MGRTLSSWTPPRIYARGPDLLCCGVERGRIRMGVRPGCLTSSSGWPGCRTRVTTLSGSRPWSISSGSGPNSSAQVGCASSPRQSGAGRQHKLFKLEPRCRLPRMSGQLVDAIIVSAAQAVRHQGREAGAQGGADPRKWQRQPAKLQQKDRDACWTFKTARAKPPLPPSRECGTACA
jgi:hypothetical protein